MKNKILLDVDLIPEPMDGGVFLIPNLINYFDNKQLYVCPQVMIGGVWGCVVSDKYDTLWEFYEGVDDREQATILGLNWLLKNKVNKK